VGSLPWNALNLEYATQVVDTLLHREQTEMARKGTQRIKADPIVTYLQDDHVFSLANYQVHLASVGMFDGVLQRFLRDAVEFLLDRERQSRLLA